ncbi:MAG: prolyl oligopeptidase family serine peptidase [Deltaproteobacteria bacterium]|nr:prolyl oligopeptidase family serine peptidase [Deltaproteobacteria bacterium]
MRAKTERKTRRWQEQRWLLDQVIKVSGLDWDQGRTGKILRNCGPGVAGEIREIGRRVQKLTDIPREFSRVAERREELGHRSDNAGHEVEAREHYYVAATFYTNAMWAVYEDGNPQRIAWEKRKRACYDKYIQYANHPIERVELPFGESTISALLHLPRKPGPGEKFSCIVYLPGMDGVKEDTPITGDPILERGMALFSIDGPGQGESRERGIKVTASNCEDSGKAAFAYLSSRPEIDGGRVAIFGPSMGSYWGTRIVAAEPGFKACAVSGVNLEPGQYTIFNTASPTFKLNYMYMAGYEDEEAFDEFAQTLTLKGLASKVSCPYLVVAGEDDELCPIEYVYELLEEVKAPKVLRLYQGEKHSIRNPEARPFIIDWLKDRLNGKPMKSEKIYVEMSGKEVHSGW